jgi:hypothetical protein
MAGVSGSAAAWASAEAGVAAGRAPTAEALRRRRQRAAHRQAATVSVTSAATAAKKIKPTASR